MRDRDIRSAPNYTVPALAMGWVNLTLALFLTRAEFGFVPALLFAAAIHHAIGRWAAIRAGR